MKLELVGPQPLTVPEPDDVLEFGAEHVVVATGSSWRNDGVGRAQQKPLAGLDALPAFTPDDWFEGRLDLKALPPGDVVVFDDDRFYLAGALAETICKAGRQVALVTPAAEVSPYTQYTLEQSRIQSTLLRLGVTIHPHRSLAGMDESGLQLSCIYTAAQSSLEAGALILVTSRLPNETLYQALLERSPEWAAAGLRSVRSIGDAEAPGTIAAAIYSGHRYARELDEPVTNDLVPFKRELPGLEETA